MKPAYDKSKYASYSESTSQNNRSNASAKERGEHTSHDNAGKSSERAGARSHERGGHGGGDGRAAHSSIGTQKALKGASYPAKKQALVKTTQTSGAVSSTLKTLRGMPGDEYDAPVAVSKAISNEE